MIEVSIHRHRNELITIYQNAFEARFGQAPVIDLNTANAVCDWAIQTMGFKRAKELMQAYLRMDDEWIKEQGFPFEVFKKQINRVIVSLGNKSQIPDDPYVVGMTETGSVILSKDPNALGKSKFTPVLYSEWKKLNPDTNDYYN